MALSSITAVQQPATGTLRLYVDGTNGNDMASGTSRATAWKTAAKLEKEIGAILLPAPTQLRIIAYVRGAFANEKLKLAATLNGETRVHVVHHWDDMTAVSTGTVNTSAASTLAHGLREMTFNGPWVPAAADLGRWMRFTIGTNAIVYQVLRVNGGTVTISEANATVPAWLVGGGAVAVEVREPSMTGLTYYASALVMADGFDSAFTPYEACCTIGISTTVAQFTECSAAVMAIWATGSGTPITLRSCAFVNGYLDRLYIPLALLQEWKLIGTNTAEAPSAGNCTPNAGMRMEGLCSGQLQGYFKGEVLGLRGGRSVVQKSSVASVDHQSGTSITLTNQIVRGGTLYGVRVGHNTESVIGKTSFLDLPAAGCTSGLLWVKRNSNMRLDASIDGVNDGTTATGLYGIVVDENGNVQETVAHNGLGGRDGYLRVIDGAAETAGGARPAQGSNGKAGGPDIYVGSLGTLYIQGNLTKSALNTSIAGAAGRPLLEVARGGRVSQLAAYAFTPLTPTADWNTDYGADGAISIHENSDVTLGTLTGGAAGTTGTGCKIKNGSRLVHKGAAGLLGAAPLDLGGLPAPIAWPAAALTDAGAVTPQACLVIPGVS